MNPHSIRFRLTTWYAGLLLIVALAFAAYTYKRLDRYLNQVLVESLSSRVFRISSTLVTNIPNTGEDYVAGEIKARYAPELNERFIRVIRPDSSILYVSGIPSDNSFDPKEVPVNAGLAAKQTTHQEVTKSGARLLVVTNPVFVGPLRYLVEVGASEAAIDRILRRFVVTLAIGLPVFVGIATFGGYLLVRWALDPVQKITGAAQEITLHHLDKRLPVPRSADEIEKLSITLNQMISRLDRSYQMSSRFTADASHELRTPLTIMRGELELLLLDKNLPNGVVEMLSSLFEETERLSKIVEGLLALSRLDTGEAQMKRVKFDLSELAATTASQMCLLAEDKEIKMTCDTNDRVEMQGDPSKMKQVLVNLLDNAIKYTPDGGAIRLSVAVHDGRARLEVADTGPGIPEAALRHVFERFYRTDEVRSREVEGTGLGLSIVQSICHAHGGIITAKNRQSGGCSFTVEMPLADNS
ncbi:MAG: ATP-binding protein [Chthoniobacteraceae bacterium]